MQEICCFWESSVFLLLLGSICILLGHGIASLFRKISLTYCAMMILYFAFMFAGGMVEVSYDDMPKAMRVVAGLLIFAGPKRK